MKTLIVYYSLEGNTKMIAECMAKELEADLQPLKPVKEISTGASKYLWGSAQILMKKKPEIMPMDKNPEEYDLILIGTPVWAFTYAPPIATFLSQVHLDQKSVAFFSCHGGQNGKTFQKLKEQLPTCQVLGEIDFFEPLKKDKDTSLQRARNWCQKLKNS